jgi:hypothetical protein
MRLQEDTYEAVKTHMFDLLAEIASRFLPNQLDMLFAKLENAQQRSTQDTQRLLGLLQHLAASDKEVNMCDKIVDMVWALTMSDTVHPDVVSLGALAGVVKAYKGHYEVNSNAAQHVGSRGGSSITSPACPPFMATGTHTRDVCIWFGLCNMSNSAAGCIHLKSRLLFVQLVIQVPFFA